MKKGVLYAIGAYLIWGFLPIYWKLLQTIPSADLAAHRMVWSLVFVVMVLIFKRQWLWLKPALTHKRTLLTFFATGILVGANWSIYIWAVNAGFIIETSLGYFINPLVSVTLGVIFFKERLRPGQGMAVALAVAGVLYLTVSYGALPWIALSLALTFGFYGLLKKSTGVDALHGLSLEMSVLFVPALVFLFYRQWQGMGVVGQASWWVILLLLGSGAVTAIPLILWFNGGFRANHKI